MRNGYVYTVDGQNSVQQAVAVANGKIVYVGSDAGVSAYIGQQTQLIDLGGRMLMPGLIDGHMHPVMAGHAMTLCSLQYQVMTKEVFQSSIQACLEASKDKGPDAWLNVIGWDRMGMSALYGDPDKSTLDALNTTRPILVQATDYHSALTNSRGLALAGITRDTPNPASGKFVRNSSGHLTGICEDEAAMQIAAHVPPVSEAELLTQTHVALDAMRQQGITSFLDAAAGEDSGRAFTGLQQKGELTARALLAIKLNPGDVDPAKAIADAQALAKVYDQGEVKAPPGVSMRHIKVFMDGIINAPADTGALLTPYFQNAGTDAAPNWVPSTNRGSAFYSPQDLKSLLLKVVQAGFDPHIHATGERAVRETLDGIEYVRQQLPGNPFRASIAHAETVGSADYGRFKALDVTATMSFQWAQQGPYTIGGTDNHLGPDRFARMEPSGSLHNAGGRIAYGSDWPVDPLDEFLALKVGVTRSGDPLNPHSFGPKYAARLNADPGLTRAEVLRAITINAAQQLRLDAVVGSVEVGKFADLIILDKNFMQVPEEQLARNEVLLTMVGGKVVWAKQPFAALDPRDFASGTKQP